jgi:hypothetical protein
MTQLENSQSFQPYLDSSVVYAILLGTQAYKQYFESVLSHPRLVSPYVQMEVQRSYLCKIIEFYFILDLDSIQNISDAIIFWSNSYKSSQHKAVARLMAQLLQQRPIALGDPQDKGKALDAIAALIIQFSELLRNRFVSTENDSTNCARAQVTLNVTDNAAEEFIRFLGAFDNVKACRSQCRIDQFLLNEHLSEIESYVQYSESLAKNSDSRGFIKIAENLKEVISQGSDACSCKRCERIGDAVIALDAPREMQLEHTDRSFDYLCPLIQQPHRKHPSEIQVVGRGGS